MTISSEARRKEPGLSKVWVARAITYQRKGFRTQTLLTSLLDPKRSPPTRSRPWTTNAGELELGYDEIKTEMLDREKRSAASAPAP